MAEGCGCEGSVERLEKELERLDHQLNGNGQEGFAQKLDRVIRWQSEAKGAANSRGEEDARHHRQNTVRLNLIMALLTAVLVWLAIFHH